MFHMYVGVRAGGGIGDEIEDPAGDEFEVERIIFDITFFFFVIVILLAIIQGECKGGIFFEHICKQASHMHKQVCCSFFGCSIHPTHKYRCRSTVSE